MSKTIQEWYQDLPEPIRSQAITNATKEGRGEVEAESLSQAVAIGFAWSETPERYPYWDDVCTRIITGEFNQMKS